MKIIKTITSTESRYFDAEHDFKVRKVTFHKGVIYGPGHYLSV